VPEASQASGPEKEISVDLSEPDATKAVDRREIHRGGDIGREARGDDDGDDDGRPRTRAERELFKRMTRFQRNTERSFQQQMAEQEARHQRELTELRQKVDGVKLERDSGASDAEHEAKIKALTEKLAAAKDRGDSAEEARLTVEISNVNSEFWAKKAQAANLTTRESSTQQRQEQQPAQRQPTRQGPTAAGSRFILANEDWWGDPKFDVENAAANTIFVRLVQQEGYDANSDETFREVTKQLKKKFPELRVRPGRASREDLDDDDDGEADDRDGSEEGERRREARRERAPAARMQDRGDANGRQVNRSSRRTLTEQEMKTMRDTGLNPDNNKDVIAFLREAQAYDAAGGR
jgi:hypothetical protein